MTYCYRCNICEQVTEKSSHGDYTCETCSTALARDYRAENSYVSVVARPTSRKRHRGRYVSKN